MINARALNHIGIAVQSIDRHRSFYEQTLGAEFEGVEEVPSQKVRAAFFKLGDVRLELLEPTDPASPIATFIEKRGEGLHHVAFTVDLMAAMFLTVSLATVLFALVFSIGAPDVEDDSAVFHPAYLVMFKAV